jgi:hypothetical protein
VIIPWCGVGKHPVTTDQTFRLVRAASTVPPQPWNGFPRGSVWTSVPLYPHEGSPGSVIVCSEHDTEPWASAPTTER